MNIDLLRRLVEPPADPLIDRAGSWNALERSMGVALPSDYRELCLTYGAGSFCDEIAIFVPFALPELGEPDLVERVTLAVTSLQPLFELTDDLEERALWPDPDGMVPCGISYSGANLLWNRSDHAELGQSCVVISREGDLEEHDLSIVALLCAWLTGELSSSVLEAARERPRTFEPSLRS